MLQVVDKRQVTGRQRGYNAPVSGSDLGSRIRALRGKRTLKEIDAVAKIGVPKLSRLERGAETNPRLKTLEAVARGLGVPVAALFSESRPESGAGLVGDPEQGSSVLDRAILAAKSEAGTWRADVAEALAALARAIGRDSDRGAHSQRPEATRR